MNKKVLLLIVFALISFSIKAQTSHSEKYLKVDELYAILYSEKDIKSDQILKIPKNTVIKSNEHYLGWHKVIYNGKEGWIFGMDVYVVDADGIE